MQGGVVELSDFLIFIKSEVDLEVKILGQVKPTGIRPLFGPRLEAIEYIISPEIFGATAADILADARQSCYCSSAICYNASIFPSI
jgi:pilus assembly protein CpaF